MARHYRKRVRSADDELEDRIDQMADEIEAVFVEADLNVGEGVLVPLMLISRIIGRILERADEPGMSELREHLLMSLRALTGVLDDPVKALAEARARQGH